jgi:hypothetical protein
MTIIEAIRNLAQACRKENGKLKAIVVSEETIKAIQDDEVWQNATNYVKSKKFEDGAFASMAGVEIRKE